jgi:hypothetical protein
MVEHEIIPFNEWRRHIQPLWPWNTDWHWIPVIHNPHGMIQYAGEEAFERIIMFPVMCSVGGVPAAFTSVYNISDTHLRIRGIYVKPEFRGQHLVTPMLEWACNLFPDPWHTAIIYAREHNIDYFLNGWFDEKMPNYSSRRREVGDSQEVDYTITLMRKKFRDIS